MPVNTFTTKCKAVLALSCIEFAIDLYKNGNGEKKGLRYACDVANKRFGAPYIQKTALNEMIKNNAELRIERNRRGFYVASKPRPVQRVFTEEEERKVLSGVLDLLDQRNFLTRADVRNVAIEVRDDIPLVSLSTRKRLTTCTFSKTWVRDFVNRKSAHIKMRKPVKIDGIRVNAFTVENVSSYFALLHPVYTEYNIRNASQVYNIDESGFSPNRDLKSESTRKVISRGSTRAVNPQPVFSYRDRVSILSCVRADGKHVVPMIVFKGSEVPNIRINRIYFSIEERLPSNMLARANTSRGGVSTELFVQWVHKFAEYVAQNHRDNEFVVLIMDGYRCHLSLHAIQYLFSFNIICLLLPAHCSHKLQPLDVSCFRAVKHYCREHCSERYSQVRRHTANQKLNLEDLVKGIVHGIDKGISESTIKSGFKKSGCFPLDAGNMDITSIQKIGTSTQMCTKTELLNKINEKKAAMADNFRSVQMTRGYIDSTRGALLSSDEAIALMTQQVDNSLARVLSEPLNEESSESD